MNEHQKNIEFWKNEIFETEKAFARMAEEQGVPAAFAHFAAEDAVLLRGEKLIKGRAAIMDSYQKNQALWKKAKLNWEPDFAEVSASGDLAYTYGHYTFSVPDSLGKVSESTGVFHTVWKRQEDNNWKFVWD